MREDTRVCKYGACDFLLRKNGRGSLIAGLPRLFVSARTGHPLGLFRRTHTAKTN